MCIMKAQEIKTYMSKKNIRTIKNNNNNRDCTL